MTGCTYFVMGDPLQSTSPWARILVRAGDSQDRKRSCLTGRGCSSLVREEVGGQRSLWPPERLGPRWCVVGLPILPGFAGVERHHLHAMQLEQFNLGNNVPHYDGATAEPVAALMFRLTGVDIGQCPVCHAGRLRVVAVFRPGQIPAPRRARGRPQPWTPRASARRVPLAPRVSAPLCAAGRRRLSPRVATGPPDCLPWPSVRPRSPLASL